MVRRTGNISPCRLSGGVCSCSDTTQRMLVHTSPAQLQEHALNIGLRKGNVTAANPSKAPTLLELCVGKCGNLPGWKRGKYTRVIGVDNDEHAIQVGQERIDSSPMKGKVTLIHGDILDDEVFNQVMSLLGNKKYAINLFFGMTRFAPGQYEKIARYITSNTVSFISAFHNPARDSLLLLKEGVGIATNTDHESVKPKMFRMMLNDSSRHERSFVGGAPPIEFFFDDTAFARVLPESFRAMMWRPLPAGYTFKSVPAKRLYESVAFLVVVPRIAQFPKLSDFEWLTVFPSPEKAQKKINELSQLPKGPSDDAWVVLVDETEMDEITGPVDDHGCQIMDITTSVSSGEVLEEGEIDEEGCPMDNPIGPAVGNDALIFGLYRELHPCVIVGIDYTDDTIVVSDDILGNQIVPRSALHTYGTSVPPALRFSLRGLRKNTKLPYVGARGHLKVSPVSPLYTERLRSWKTTKGCNNGHYLYHAGFGCPLDSGESYLGDDNLVLKLGVSDIVVSDNVIDLGPSFFLCRVGSKGASMEVHEDYSVVHQNNYYKDGYVMGDYDHFHVLTGLGQQLSASCGHGVFPYNQVAVVMFNKHSDRLDNVSPHLETLTSPFQGRFQVLLRGELEYHCEHKMGAYDDMRFLLKPGTTVITTETFHHEWFTNWKNVQPGTVIAVFYDLVQYRTTSVGNQLAQKMANMDITSSDWSKHSAPWQPFEVNFDPKA